MSMRSLASLCSHRRRVVRSAVDARRSLRLEPLEPRILLDAGLVGEYFDQISLTGLATTRVDPQIEFPSPFTGNPPDWGGAPPGTTVQPDDNWSERWTGFVRLESTGTWTFYTDSNDGVRLWVDGVGIIDHWDQHVVTEDSGTVTRDAGWYPIRLEHFQEGGTAAIRLRFEGPGSGNQVIPSTHLNTEQPDTGDPVADAGADQHLVLPDDSVTLHGSGSDSDGTITAYAWTKQSGPSVTMSGADTADLALSDLVEGVHVFRLTVTDNDGKTDWDEVTVSVVPE